MSVRVYAAHRREAAPVWDWERLGPRPCLASAVGRSLAPGDSLPNGGWKLEIPTRAIVGDSLPLGRYAVYVSPPVIPVGMRRWERIYAPVGTLNFGPASRVSKAPR